MFKGYAIDKNNSINTLIHIFESRGSSVVEQKPEELWVDGSIPSPGTILFFFLSMLK
jgi:hypothetical protein